MALDLTQPFQWGAGGAPMTPQAAEAQRKVAQALLMQGMDYSPVRSPWQGAARVAQALVGGFESAQADASDKKLAEMQPQMLAAALTGETSPTQPIASGASVPMGTTSIPSGTIDPRLSSAISTAASANNVDPAYMTRLALVENGGRINGGSSLSSAQGPFQFLSGTARQYGLTNPNDPAASADAAARLTLDNKAALTSALGREPTPGELYLAHQQGVGGAIKLLQNPNAPVESVIGAQAARNNGAAPGMTAGQFANKWIGKFGDIVQTADPAQKNIIDAQADAPAAPMAFAGTQQPAGAPVATAAPVAPAAIPATPQPASSASMAKIAPLISLASSPYASAATKQIAGVLLSSQLSAIQKANDPMTALDRQSKILGIEKAQRDLQPVGEAYHDADGNLVQKDASGKVTMLSAADKRPTSVGEYGFYADQEIKAGRTPLPYGQWDIARRRSGATNVNTGTIPKGYEQIQDPITGAVSMRPIPGGPADTSKQDKTKADAQDTASNVITNAANLARTALSAPGLPASGTVSTVLSPVGETNAAELRRQIEVLKSNASIETLNQMRQQSRTGGALGSVTEGEERLLAAKSGALDPKAPPEKLGPAIDDYERTLLQIVHGKEAGNKIFEATRKNANPTATRKTSSGVSWSIQ